MTQVNSSYKTFNWFPKATNASGVQAFILPGLLFGTTILVSVMVTAFIGNFMVIYAVFNHRPLKRVQNFFIVSLAGSDLAVALLVMPLHVVTLIAGKWTFGMVTCQIWLTLDVLLCTASIFNLCAIALDRYWAIHNPIKYANRRTKRLVLAMIAAVWMASLLVSAPPLLGWNNWSQEGLADTCVYTTQKGFVVYSACCSFYIPLVIMTTVYCKIFVAARQRLHRRNTTVKKGLSIVEKSMREPIEIPKSAEATTIDGFASEYGNSLESDPNPVGSPRRYLLVPYPDGFQRSNSRRSNRSIRSNRSTTSRSSRRSYFHRRLFKRSSTRMTIQGEFTSEGGTDNLNSFFREKERISLSREKRAAKTLAIIMGGFVLCWLPFFTLYLLDPFLRPGSIDGQIFQVANWLGYINSSINPVLYTIFNMDFRMAFRRILLCKR